MEIPPEQEKSEAFSPFEIIPGGYLETDPAGVILEVDRSAAVLLRAAPHRLTGKSIQAFLDSSEQARVEEILRKALEAERVSEFDLTLQFPGGTAKVLRVALVTSRSDAHPEGILRWLLRDTSGAAQPIETERPDELIRINQRLAREIENRKNAEDALLRAQDALEKSVRERTEELKVANQMLRQELVERRRAEVATEKREKELRALHTATSVLLKTLDLDVLIGQILDAATTAIPAGEKGMLHLMARDTGQLEMRAVIGYTDPRIQKFTFPSSKGYVAKATRQRMPLLINDVQSDPNIRYDGTIPEVRAIQSAIVVPLIFNDEVLGMLSLDSSEKNAFTEDDLQLLVSFAATATAVIRNALLHAEVQKLALTDTLTNVYNRRGLSELGRREIERARRFNRPLSAILLDMDAFKDVNDTYGHANGDTILHLVADRILHNIREVDVMARYGGDEFVILLPETDLFVASNVAERLRKCIVDLPFQSGEVQVSLSISLGVARLTQEMADLNQLLNQADAALYTAKQHGRNRVEIA